MMKTLVTVALALGASVAAALAQAPKAATIDVPGLIAEYGAKVKLKATVRDKATNAPVDNARIFFHLGAETLQGHPELGQPGTVTAECLISTSLPPGPNIIQVEFTGQSDSGAYASAKASGSIVVHRAPVSLTLGKIALAEPGAPQFLPGKLNLAGNLARKTDNTPIANAQVQIRRNGAPMQSVTTNAKGRFWYTADPPAPATNFEAAFDGDAHYLPEVTHYTSQ